MYEILHISYFTRVLFFFKIQLFRIKSREYKLENAEFLSGYKIKARLFKSCEMYFLRFFANIDSPRLIRNLQYLFCPSLVHMMLSYIMRDCVKGVGRDAQIWDQIVLSRYNGRYSTWTLPRSLYSNFNILEFLYLQSFNIKYKVFLLPPPPSPPHPAPTKSSFNTI